MKRYLLLLAFLLVIVSDRVNAQCAIRNLQTNVISSTPTGSQCTVVFDLSFELDVNGGNKRIIIQSWEASKYPTHWTNSCSKNRGAPNGTNLSSGGALPFINIAINSETFAKLTTYNPDPTVPLTSYESLIAGDQISADGFKSITLKNVTVLAPTCSGITMITDIWASQANNTNWVPGCVSCNNSYAFNYPTIEGFQTCPNGIREFNFDVTNNNTNQSITYTYEVYRDQNLDNIYSNGDVRVDVNNMPITLQAQQVKKYASKTYIGNVGTEANQRLFIVLTLAGVANPVVEQCAQSICAPLPVSLKQFNAKLNNNVVALTWETADEINNKGFEIQRRLNGEASYQKIAFVEAKATQGLGASYSFTDANARNKGSVSYRLAQTDVDGKISLSEIRIVNTGAGNSQIAVYPNPSKGTVRVSLPTQLSKADISLEDFSGKTIQRWNAYSANTLQIDQIRPGIYLIRVRLQETGEQMIERLIVQ